jgi:hypothetical protein
MNIDQLTGEQIRKYRRDWLDKGGYKAVNRGTLEPFHRYIENLVLVDADPINTILANEKVYQEAA